MQCGAAQDSCRGGWLLSTVSVLILRDIKTGSCESEQQRHKQQELTLPVKLVESVSFGLYSVGHQFESQDTRLYSLRIFMDFLSSSKKNPE
jgi:hypothetical protein